MVNNDRRLNALSQYFAGLSRSTSKKMQKNQECMELRSIGGHGFIEKKQAPKNTTFQCQLSEGCGKIEHVDISSFRGIDGLYEKLADLFQISAESILFCTVNDHKPNVNSLLLSRITAGDDVYIHRRGQAKEVEILKSEEILGLTITDNSAGKTIVKRLKKDSIMDRLYSEHVFPGDFIEKINGISCLGKRHFEVSKFLRSLPVGQCLTIRFVEPIKGGFCGINFHKSATRRTNSPQLAKQTTLRIKASGNTAIVEHRSSNWQTTKAIESVNCFLEDYLGISDVDLAQQIYEIWLVDTNPSYFIDRINTSELAVFEFSIEFMLDLWAAIDDVVRAD